MAPATITESDSHRINLVLRAAAIQEGLHWRGHLRASRPGGVVSPHAIGQTEGKQHDDDDRDGDDAN